uniref:Uncharacterized protein n=1 Tax=Romanomermis culicivorax TaxID=13658 RepID=A0A915KCZ2_ROMCU
MMEHGPSLPTSCGCRGNGRYSKDRRRKTAKKTTRKNGRQKPVEQAVKEQRWQREEELRRSTGSYGPRQYSHT